MTQAIETEMQSIRLSVRDAYDLQELKSNIESHLQSIGMTIENYVNAETRRAQEAEITVTDLHEQLQLMERETTMLRDSIREEHGRALRDALTGVPNRLAYEERIAHEFARWKRQDTGLSIVLIDIDFFKRINDTYGHQAGDRVLRTVAAQLARQVRDTDFFGRFGGEEFVLLLPNTRLADALRVAEKLRANIESCHFHHRAEPVTVTVSCGLAEFHEGDTPEDVFRRADESLYLAKREGRNRCSNEEELEAA
jgi:diguanylate cyclase